MKKKRTDKKSKKKKKKKQPKKVAKSYTPLEGHKRKKKELIPPFAAIEKLKPSSWIDDRLPEFIWCALLLTRLGREDGLEIIRLVANRNQDIRDEVSSPDVALTSISEMPDKRRASILDTIFEHPDAKVALRPLLFFHSLPFKAEWESKISAEPEEEDWHYLKIAVAHSLDHQSQIATDCRWARILMKVASGQLRLGSKEDVNNILHYPVEGDMTLVRPYIRSTELAFTTAMESKLDWPISFWEQCYTDTDCEGIVTNSPDHRARKGTTREKVNEVRKQLVACFNENVKDTKNYPKKDAIFGIAAYALAIVFELLYLGNSSSIIGRLALRTLAYCYITRNRSAPLLLTALA